MKQIFRFSLLCLVLFGILAGQGLSPKKQNVRVAQLIEALHHQRWPGAINLCNPTCWQFSFTEAMTGLLEIGAVAQEPLLAKLVDPEITDQVMILLGGVGDERAVEPIITALKSASSEPLLDRRRKMVTAGNLALTNITVADVIWHHGGGITIDACPNDPTGCWSSWWQRNKPTFRVKDIRQSRRYSNYPNYGIYHGLP